MQKLNNVRLAISLINHYFINYNDVFCFTIGIGTGYDLKLPNLVIYLNHPGADDLFC